MTTALSVQDAGGLKKLLSSDAMKQAIAEVLPQHLTPERMIKMALIAASRNPKLYECTSSSVMKAVLDASQLGLDCSGSLGSGYLVPYFNNNIKKREVQFIPGYRGLIDLARRSGEISTIHAQVVYENETFIYELGDNPHIRHKRDLCAPRVNEKLIAAYAVATLTDGKQQIEVMSRDEIDAIRARSKAANNGPWVTDFSEMCRKTVVRRIIKYLPISVEKAALLNKALELDNQSYDQNPPRRTVQANSSGEALHAIMNEESQPEAEIVDAEEAPEKPTALEGYDAKEIAAVARRFAYPVYKDLGRYTEEQAQTILENLQAAGGER